MKIGGRPPGAPKAQAAGPKAPAAKPAAQQAAGQKAAAKAGDGFKASTTEKKTAIPALTVGAAPGADQNQKVSEMGFSPVQLASLTEKAKNLSVGDLKDLAAKMAGKSVDNAKVNDLTMKDLKGLEDVFRDQRDQTGEDLDATGGKDMGQMAAGISSISCCSCTPCCCCAAVEIDPFEE